MALDLTTPALLFPAISLLLLAYTNRFLTIANLTRSLHGKYKKDPHSIIYGQIENLRVRIQLIKRMQILLYIDYYLAGSIVFAVSLIMLIISLWQSILEIRISTEALSLELSDMETGNSRM